MAAIVGQIQVRHQNVEEPFRCVHVIQVLYNQAMVNPVERFTLSIQTAKPAWAS